MAIATKDSKKEFNAMTGKEKAILLMTSDQKCNLKPKEFFLRRAAWSLVYFTIKFCLGLNKFFPKYS